MSITPENVAGFFLLPAVPQLVGIPIVSAVTKRLGVTQGGLAGTVILAAGAYAMYSFADSTRSQGWHEFLRGGMWSTGIGSGLMALETTKTYLDSRKAQLRSSTPVAALRPAVKTGASLSEAEIASLAQAVH